MIAEITRWIMDLMQAHGPLTVFVGVIIESIIVPIPSPLIIMGAGALLIPAGLSWKEAFSPILLQIVIPGAIASTLGAYLTYGIAYWGGKPMVDRFQKFLGFGWEDVLTLEKRLLRHSLWMIFLLRALPVVPLSLVSAAAGGLRLPVGRFTWATLAGSIPRCLFLGYLGHLTRDSYEGLAGQVNRIESLVSGAIVLAAVVLVVWLRLRLKH